MMCDARLWTRQATALSGGWRIHCGNLAGSDSIAGMAAQILDWAPERFALAGLSMGGIVAMAMWRQAPERIERLALLDTNFRADTDERRALRNAQMARVTAGELASVLRDELKPNYLARCHRGDPALLDEVLAMGLDLGERCFIRQSMALRDRIDSTDTLATIDCPTLVLCGDEDSLCPVALHEEMAALIPGASLQVVARCGHLSAMEQPEAVNRALQQWLGTN